MNHFRARWRENRTIFNTPNARLMNVSLLRDNKLLHTQERRGSRASVRVPSRQPSMVSLRAHSPNASQGAKHNQHSQHRVSRTGFYSSLTKQATCYSSTVSNRTDDSSIYPNIHIYNVRVYTCDLSKRERSNRFCISRHTYVCI